MPISAAVMVFAAFATNASADEVVKIGQVAPLTGDIAHLGKDNKNGARLAVEEISSMPRTKRPTRVPPPKSPRRWSTTRSPSCWAHLNSGTTIPALKIYSDAGIVQISPSATNPAYT